MAKQTIEIEVPDGYEFDRIKISAWRKHYHNEIANESLIVMRKKKSPHSVYVYGKQIKIEDITE